MYIQTNHVGNSMRGIPPPCFIFPFWTHYLVTSSAFWTFACTDPSKSAPIFFNSCVSSTNSQSCRSSLWTWMKSTSVSKNILNTYKVEEEGKRVGWGKRGKDIDVCWTYKQAAVRESEAEKGSALQPSRKKKNLFCFFTGYKSTLETLADFCRSLTIRYSMQYCQEKKCLLWWLAQPQFFQ